MVPVQPQLFIGKIVKVGERNMTIIQTLSVFHECFLLKYTCFQLGSKRKNCFPFSLVLNHVFMYLHPKIAPNSNTSLEAQEKITARTKGTSFSFSLFSIYVCNNSIQPCPT